ncbi:MAG: hypothetical protein M1824_002867 [Vezdaea acicularis]|nr:MAG: hypothetical protein M1824_002867 [Vezdaea acicularis]
MALGVVLANRVLQNPRSLEQPRILAHLSAQAGTSTRIDQEEGKLTPAPNKLLDKLPRLPASARMEQINDRHAPNLQHNKGVMTGDPGLNELITVPRGTINRPMETKPMDTLNRGEIEQFDNYPSGEAHYSKSSTALAGTVLNGLGEEDKKILRVSRSLSTDNISISLPSGSHQSSDGRSSVARLRSPFQYPTRLKRPGFRTSSPGISENGLSAASNLANISPDQSLWTAPSSPRNLHPYDDATPLIARGVLFRKNSNFSSTTSSLQQASRVKRAARGEGISTLRSSITFPQPIGPQNDIFAKSDYSTEVSPSSPEYYDYSEGFEDKFYTAMESASSSRSALNDDYFDELDELVEASGLPVIAYQSSQSTCFEADLDGSTSSVVPKEHSFLSKQRDSIKASKEIYNLQSKKQTESALEPRGGKPSCSPDLSRTPKEWLHPLESTAQVDGQDDRDSSFLNPPRDLNLLYESNHNEDDWTLLSSFHYMIGARPPTQSFDHSRPLSADGSPTNSSRSSLVCSSSGIVEKLPAIIFGPSNRPSLAPDKSGTPTPTPQPLIYSPVHNRSNSSITVELRFSKLLTANQESNQIQGQAKEIRRTHTSDHRVTEVDSIRSSDIHNSLFELDHKRSAPMNSSRFMRPAEISDLPVLGGIGLHNISGGVKQVSFDKEFMQSGRARHGKPITAPKSPKPASSSISQRAIPTTHSNIEDIETCSPGALKTSPEILEQSSNPKRTNVNSTPKLKLKVRQRIQNQHIYSDGARTWGPKDSYSALSVAQLSYQPKFKLKVTRPSTSTLRAPTVQKPSRFIGGLLTQTHASSDMLVQEQSQSQQKGIWKTIKRKLGSKREYKHATDIYGPRNFLKGVDPQHNYEGSIYQEGTAHARSFFSDDSSQTRRLSNVRKRLSQLRARLPSTKTTWVSLEDLKTPGSNEQYTTGITPGASVDCTNQQPATVGMSDFEYRTSKLMEKIKKWSISTVECLLNLVAKIRGKAQQGPGS